MSPTMNAAVILSLTLCAAEASLPPGVPTSTLSSPR